MMSQTVRMPWTRRSRGGRAHRGVGDRGHQYATKPLHGEVHNDKKSDCDRQRHDLPRKECHASRSLEKCRLDRAPHIVAPHDHGSQDHADDGTDVWRGTDVEHVDDQILHELVR